MEVTEKRSKPDVEIRERNHVRITGGGKIRHYCAYGARLLCAAREGSEEGERGFWAGKGEHSKFTENEKGAREVVLVAQRDAVGKCVSVAEILKRSVGGLHQITTVSSVEMEGKEGHYEVAIRISLSLDAPADANTLGYQAP